MAQWTSWRSPGAINDVAGVWTPDSGTDLSCVLSDDDVYTVSSDVGIGNAFVDYNYGFAAEVPPGSTIHDIEWELIHRNTGTLDPYVGNGSLQVTATAVAIATEKTWNTSGGSGTEATKTLSSWSALPTCNQVRSTNFGAYQYYTAPGGAKTVRLERIRMRVNFTPGLGVSETYVTQRQTRDMDIRKILEAGGLTFISDQSIANLTASVGLTVPALARVAMITVRGAKVSIRGSGTATTTNGNDYEVGTHWLPYRDLAAIRMIESGGTASVLVSYFSI